MIATNSVLQMTALQSALASGSQLNPKGVSMKKNIVADLLLTALIDAFSILVIFLLMQFSSTGDILHITKGMELPKANIGDVLERNVVVKVEEGKFYLEDKEVTADGVLEGLLALREKFQSTHAGEEFPGVLTIQADRRTKYESLNQVVLAAAHAGYSDVRFAVVLK